VADVYAKVRLSVVEIRTSEGVGSGWAIEQGWVITNEHVVGADSNVTVLVPAASGGVRSLNGIVRGRDTKRDLAAVEVDHRATPLPRRKITSAEVGLDIVQLGYSAGVNGVPSVHTGVVSAVLVYLGGVNMNTGVQKKLDDGSSTESVGIVVFDADADPGDSGGPVVDMSGTVIGTTYGSVINSGSKRVLGQQRATGVRDIDLVWEDLKKGVNTSAR
jgi:S1-C subfamily serine protease